MMRVSKNTVDARSSYRKLAQTRRGGRRVVRQFMFAMGIDMKKEAQKEIDTGSKTGAKRPRAVRKRWPRSSMRASAAGETHANLSWRTRNSIGWKVNGVKQLRFGYGVAPQKQKMPSYAPFLEEGTPRGQMGARPSLLNAIRATSGRQQKHWERLVRKYDARR